jgi:hypothetical protein
LPEAAGTHAAAGEPGWLEQLRASVETDLASHIVDGLTREDERIVFVDSAAWAARLRLNLAARGEPLVAGRMVVRIRQPVRNRTASQ